jgi:hypothetical protein
MLIQNKIQRTRVTRTFLAIIPGAAIATALTYYLVGPKGSPQDFWVTILVIVVGLQVVYTAILIKASIWGWIVWRWLDREKLIEAVLANLRRRDFPEPADYINGVTDYLIEVKENDALPFETRAAAVSELTTLFLAAMQWRRRVVPAYEEALERYKRGFTAPSVSRWRHSA